jgi:HPt (histidine-containing phosphotransfer) domain-containing protein
MTEREKVLDLAAIENLREMVGGDETFLAELIDTFIGEAPQMLADMRQSVEEGDAELLQRAAHSFKSNSAEFGAMALSDLCRELEKMGKNGKLEGVTEKINRIETEYEPVKAALKALQRR